MHKVQNKKGILCVSCKKGQGRHAYPALCAIETADAVEVRQP